MAVLASQLDSDTYLACRNNPTGVQRVAQTFTVPLAEVWTLSSVELTLGAVGEGYNCTVSILNTVDGVPDSSDSEASVIFAVPAGIGSPRTVVPMPITLSSGVYALAIRVGASDDELYEVRWSAQTGGGE